MEKSPKDIGAIIGAILGAVYGSQKAKTHPRTGGVAGGLVGALAGDQLVSYIMKLLENSQNAPVVLSAVEFRGKKRGWESLLALVTSFCSVYGTDIHAALFSDPKREISKAEIREAFEAKKDAWMSAIEEALLDRYEKTQSLVSDIFQETGQKVAAEAFGSLLPLVAEDAETLKLVGVHMVEAAINELSID